MFCDYLTKWPEVFPTKDQTALTVAQLLVREVIPRHGIPRQLLSDRGSVFLSKLMMEIYKLLGVKKVNTTAYHPQCDGLVERFNRSLIDMLSKTVQTHGQDWDEKLPFILCLPCFYTTVHPRVTFLSDVWPGPPAAHGCNPGA